MSAAAYDSGSRRKTTQNFVINGVLGMAHRQRSGTWGSRDDPIEEVVIFGVHTHWGAVNAPVRHTERLIRDKTFWRRHVPRMHIHHRGRHEIGEYCGPAVMKELAHAARSCTITSAVTSAVTLAHPACTRSHKEIWRDLEFLHPLLQTGTRTGLLRAACPCDRPRQHICLQCQRKHHLRASSLGVRSLAIPCPVCAPPCTPDDAVLFLESAAPDTRHIDRHCTFCASLAGSFSSSAKW
jgi:hypothetical protein